MCTLHSILLPVPSDKGILQAILLFWSKCNSSSGASQESINVMALCNDFAAKFLEDLLWSIIKNMAIKFYDDNNDSQPGEPQNKRQRT
jgi:hypothetical protein